MGEIWEKAIETALDGETNCSSVRTLTLDGAVKCFQVRLPPPALLEKFQNLEHLSIANAGVSSLENFPHLPKLRKLILSDNRISGGLEFLVQAGLGSLRDLDLSNNRIQYIEDLAPLAQLKLVSLDLYECPITKIENYGSRVFGLIRSLKYLDEMDADDNERPESDEEEEEEDDEDEPVSGEIDGRYKSHKRGNCEKTDAHGIFDGDEDVESDADEEEAEIVTISGGSNGFHVTSPRDEDESEEDVEEEDADNMGEEIDEEGDGDDVVEVHEIDDSDDGDGVEDDGEDADNDEDGDPEEVDDEDLEPVTMRQLPSIEGEIDGHDDDEEDENGEIGEDEELSSEDGKYGDDDIEDEDGMEFLVQPVVQVEEEDDGGSDFDGEDEDIDDEGVHDDKPSTSYMSKKKINDENNDAVEEEKQDKWAKNGDQQSNPSISLQSKKKRNREDGDGDAEDESISDARFKR